MNTFFVTTGCYLGLEHERVETDMTAAEYCRTVAYPQALEETEGWYGLHGFGVEEEDFEGTPEEYEAQRQEECEDAAEYSVVPYVPEEHDDQL